MTVGESARASRVTALAKPGGPTISAEPELTTSQAGLDALDGPFTTRQLLRLDEALRVADQQTGLTFSVYIGELEEPVRDTPRSCTSRSSDPADGGADRGVAEPAACWRSSPATRPASGISDRDAKLAALSMAASFAGGDLAGGVLSGLDQLATHAGRH